MTALSHQDVRDAAATLNAGAAATVISGQSPVTTPSRIPVSIVAGVTQLGEIALLALSGLAIAGGWVGNDDAFVDSRYVLAVAMAAVAGVLIARRMGLYTSASLAHPLRHLPRFFAAWTAAMVSLATAVFLFKTGPDFSRGWLLLWFAAGFGLIAAERFILGRQVRAWIEAGRISRRAVVYGAGPEGRALIDAIEADASGDVQICGVFDDREGERIATTIAGYPRLGNIDQLLSFCRATPIDMLIVSLPITAEERVLQVLKKLWVLPVDIRLAAHSNRLKFRPRAYSFIGSVPLIDIFDKPLADWDNLLKSIFDKTVAVAALTLLSPVMALVALAVRLDSKGPILFRQKRLGFNNELIEVFKFRSMYVNDTDSGAARLVTKGDPRVTRVGRFIRKTSLDELPQLFNVLLGTLSLVGPRPHALQAKAADQLYHEVVDGYFARHKVKPGITGWAQINGWRGETDTPEKIQKRVEHDLYYIENWSLFLDVYILLRTPLALLKTDNAY